MERLLERCVHCSVMTAGKGFSYSLPSVGPRADPGVQAVGPQVTISHPPGGRLPLLSNRPARVTFPAAEHHRPLAGTKLYCSATEAHRCEQLAEGCYAALPRAGFEPTTCWSQVQCSARCDTAVNTTGQLHTAFNNSKSAAKCERWNIFKCCKQATAKEDDSFCYRPDSTPWRPRVLAAAVRPMNGCRFWHGTRRTWLGCAQETGPGLFDCRTARKHHMRLVSVWIFCAST